MPSRKKNRRQMPQTKKERNTQRRKRKTGLEHKAYQMGTLCGYELVQIMYNPEKDEHYVFMTTDRMQWNVDEILARPNTQIKFSRDIERSLTERERKKVRRVREEAPSLKVTPARVVVAKDQVPPEREKTRAVPFLPDPPSFDLEIKRNQWHGLLQDQDAMVEGTRPGATGRLNLLSSACDLVPYL